MGRKNKRRKSCYGRKLGFNPKWYTDSAGHSNGHPDSDADQVFPPMYRGDVWFANLGRHPGSSVQSGWAPVLIVSNNMANLHAGTVTVLPMTRKRKRPELPCHVMLEPESVGVVSDWALSPSTLLAEQITTIGKCHLRHFIGKVRDARLMQKIADAVKAQLALDAQPEQDAKVALDAQPEQDAKVEQGAQPHAAANDENDREEKE